jgi:hypothetical protein
MTITPATRSGQAAAWIKAIEPPSLWPISTGRSIASAASKAGKRCSASSCRYAAVRGRRQRSRVAVPEARPDQRTTARRLRNLHREITPQGDTAEALMEKYQGRPILALGRNQTVLERLPPDVNESHRQTTSRKSRTMPICCWSRNIGACPTPAISAVCGRGPRMAMACIVSRVNRSDSAPRTTSVGQRIRS